MKLSEYLNSNDISQAEFARRIGAKSRATVGRYITKTNKIPCPVMMAAIQTETKGCVTIADFLPSHIKTKSKKFKNSPSN